MKQNGRSFGWVGRVSRSVLENELKLYSLIWTLNIISRDAKLRNQIQVKLNIKTFLISTWLTTDFSKSSLLQKNVGESFPVFVDCSLPSYKEVIVVMVAMLESFHSRLDLRWIFTRWMFLIKQTFLSK